MKRIIILITFFFWTFSSFGQKIEQSFIDNFKTSKWKSVDNFNDSTIIQLKEIKLVRWDPSVDTLRHKPALWIFNDEFKIKYYYNTIISQDSNSVQTKTSYNTLDCQYSYDNNKGILTIILDNKDKTTLTYKTAIVSSGSFIILTRKKIDFED
jgi:hypothetical protein